MLLLMVPAPQGVSIGRIPIYGSWLCCLTHTQGVQLTGRCRWLWCRTTARCKGADSPQPTHAFQHSRHGMQTQLQSTQ